jgi:hypothetical protein
VPDTNRKKRIPAAMVVTVQAHYVRDQFFFEIASARTNNREYFMTNFLVEFRRQVS